jgi:hypothetical protein
MQRLLPDTPVLYLTPFSKTMFPTLALFLFARRHVTYAHLIYHELLRDKPAQNNSPWPHLLSIVSFPDI